MPQTKRPVRLPVNDSTIMKTMAEWDAVDMEEPETWSKVEMATYHDAGRLVWVECEVYHIRASITRGMSAVNRLYYQGSDEGFDSYIVCTGLWVTSLFRFQARLTRTLLQSPRGKWMVYWHDRQLFVSDDDAVLGWLTQ